MSPRSLRTGLLVLLSLCPCALSAQTEFATPPSGSIPDTAPASTPKTRGNGALFGGTDTRSGDRPVAVDATLSISGGYDDDLSGGTTLQEPVAGEVSDLSGGLSLSHRGQHSRFTARGSTSLREYPSLHRFAPSTHSAAATLNIDLTRTTSLQSTADGTYVSEFAFDTISRQSDLGSAALTSAGLDVASLDGARLSYGAAVGLVHRVGRRSAFTLTASGRNNERRIIREMATERSVGGRFSRTLGRDATFGFEYNLRSSTQQLGSEERPTWSHDVQVDFERRWRHSRERRTILNFSVGPSLLQASSSSDLPAALVPRTDRPIDSRQFEVIGTAALRHDMSRSWNLGATYRRGAGSADGLLSDSATLDLTGLISRRIELGLSGGYLKTDLGLVGVENRFTTEYGSGRLQIALTRAIALYGQYVLYEYDFGSASSLSAGLAAHQRRRGARVGLTFWLPIYEGR